MKTANAMKAAGIALFCLAIAGYEALPIAGEAKSEPRDQQGQQTEQGRRGQGRRGEGLRGQGQRGQRRGGGQRGRGGRGGPRGVYKSSIDAHWIGDNARFWYRNDLRGGAREFILVDAEAGERGAAFDRARLAASLSSAAGETYAADRLPFDDIEFADDGGSIRFNVGEVGWTCNLSSYECTKSADAFALDLGRSSVEFIEAPRDEASPLDDASLFQAPPSDPFVALERDQQGQRGQAQRGGGRGDRAGRGGGGGRGGRGNATPTSSDGKWTAFVRDNNVFLRDADGAEKPLSEDGVEGDAYGRLDWSPDSAALIAFRTHPVERKEVYLISSSPDGGGRAELRTRGYALPGDEFTSYELGIFNPETGEKIEPRVERVDFGNPSIRWREDGRRFMYQKIDRGHQRFRLIQVDSRTGDVENVIDERTDTFIWTAHRSGVPPILSYLDDTEEIVWATEKDGWRHLYLVHPDEPGVYKPITRGEWVVRGVQRVDEENRQIWFSACGVYPDQDPYFIHYGRVNFDGTGLVWLTEGDGTHSIEYSPDRRFIIDTYSRVDRAPVNELRRVSDGSLVTRLEESDITELIEGGWRAPEVVVAKGRDGETDIWGIIVRPRDFDPAQKYPVIEDIYAGPHSAFAPKSFSATDRYSSLTRLGFIVAKLDGMGTAHRSKAFHDVCWQNVADAGFPDRIAWHKAAAAKHDHYDISRVGIYGTSAGGQNAMGGLLFHPEFYKAAMAACGCHDNRMDKASWNEQWMGYPVGPHYAASSNVDNAHRLQGKLLLIVGELDTNVPPESTLRVVDALINAEKDFDFIMVPGMGHSNGGAYGRRRMEDFFVKHLLGQEPPDRNAGSVSGR
jgi:dipeptidyl aminopeptidase/acylaminoacyl peptidase